MKQQCVAAATRLKWWMRGGGGVPKWLCRIRVSAYQREVWHGTMLALPLYLLQNFADCFAVVGAAAFLLFALDNSVLHKLLVVRYEQCFSCTCCTQGFRILSAHVGCMHELSITSLLTFGHCYFLDSSQRVLHANIVFSWVKIAVISTHIADSWCCFDFYSLFSHSS